MPTFDEAMKMATTDRYVNCYISLKLPPISEDSVVEPSEIEKENEWKVYVTTMTWKSSFAYQVGI